MNENERKPDHDIWVKGIKTIVGHHKKSLLDYADALESNKGGQPSSMGSMKAKIHNDLSQIQLTMGILFETFRAGGTIEPFSDSFNRTHGRNDANKSKVSVQRP